MITIAFDTWVVLEPRLRYSGIAVYARELLREFRRQAATSATHVISFVKRNQAIDFNSVNGFTNIEAPMLETPIQWKVTGASFVARSNGADVLFVPAAQVIPTPLLPVVTTIHDATSFTVAGTFTALGNVRDRIMHQIAAKFSGAVLTVSEWSKRDIINLLGVPEHKIFVTYPGYRQHLVPDTADDDSIFDNLKRHWNLNKPYIIHCGTIQPRKNLKRLIESYQYLLGHHPDLDFDLVLVGGKGWQSEGIYEAAAKANLGRIVLTGGLPDSELSVLLKRATLAIIPSVYEGFCSPLAESMACGVPTITSSSSCLPEVSGNVLHYFDPTSIEDMAAAIELGMRDAEFRERLRVNGLKRARDFSYERCARETLNVLKSVGERHRQ